ncbi:hypothetical protein PAXRUDRAFT_18865 [Paxillus rubicundulus Ve08.2h10]|uniref:Uncharacterized protein n=1 Tax=Paxillus rubicundulus Ve08.2h10 TaxID=930991 RepID=A0A0D0CK52_9AGAM|nr:hypothetical protein PAXRUDRAFT_18865 [Paxillus rubicundulus Ve08.2h10]
MKLLCRVGDLQKGEKYVNMAYLFFSTLVIFRAAQVNSASPEPTPNQVRFSTFLFSPFLCLPVSLHFHLLLNFSIPVP